MASKSISVVYIGAITFHVKDFFSIGARQATVYGLKRQRKIGSHMPPDLPQSTIVLTYLPNFGSIRTGKMIPSRFRQSSDMSSNAIRICKDFSGPILPPWYGAESLGEPIF